MGGTSDGEIGDGLHAAGLFAAAEAGDEDGHEFGGFFEGERGLAGAQHVDESDKLTSESVVGVGELEGEIAFGTVEMDRAEAAVGVVDCGDGETDAAAVGEMHEVASGIALRLDGEETGAEQGLDGFQCVDAVALPGFAGETGDPAQISEVCVLGIGQAHLWGVAHTAGGKEDFALALPLNKLGEVGRVGGEGFVDEDGQSGLDEGAGAAHVIVAIIGGDDDGIDLTDDVERIGDDVFDQAGSGDFGGI